MGTLGQTLADNVDTSTTQTPATPQDSQVGPPNVPTAEQQVAIERELRGKEKLGLYTHEELLAQAQSQQAKPGKDEPRLGTKDPVTGQPIDPTALDPNSPATLKPGDPDRQKVEAAVTGRNSNTNEYTALQKEILAAERNLDFANAPHKGAVKRELAVAETDALGGVASTLALQGDLGALLAAAGVTKAGTKIAGTLEPEQGIPFSLHATNVNRDTRAAFEHRQQEKAREAAATPELPPLPSRNNPGNN